SYIVSDAIALRQAQTCSMTTGNSRSLFFEPRFFMALVTWHRVRMDAFGVRGDPGRTMGIPTPGSSRIGSCVRQVGEPLRTQRSFRLQVVAVLAVPLGPPSVLRWQEPETWSRTNPFRFKNWMTTRGLTAGNLGIIEV